MEIKANIKKIYKLIVEFINKLDENHIYLTSAGIAFNIILYQIPLFLLVTYVVDLTIGFDQLAIELESILKDFLPPTATSSKYITRVITEIKDIVNHSSIFGFIGMVVLVWISSTLISSLRYSINRVFKIEPLKTAFLDMLKDMLLVILIPFLFIAYTFLIPLVDIVLSFLAEFSPETFQGLISNFTVILTSLGTGFIIYYFIYSYIPSKKVERKKRLMATILNTIFIEISRNIFAWYLINLSQYSKYYGAYATIVSIALWIYYFAFIFLISAEISQMYFEKKEEREEECKIEV